MRYTRISLLASLILTLGLVGLRAQEAVSTSGGNFTGDGGTVSYTIGLIAYTTVSSPEGSVNQGVQQPYEFFTVGIDDYKDIKLELSAGPNPTSESVKLIVENYKPRKLSYQLYDIRGGILQKGLLEGKETSIEMRSLVPATYFLKVMENATSVKIFKIIKN